MQFALFHSPLVGPTTWQWVAASLVTAGHDVAVPDLRDAAASGDPGVMIAAAAAAVPGGWSSPVLVGHSGFGTILPSVSERLGRHSLGIVFVDAGLPPCEGPATPGADFLDHLPSCRSRPGRLGGLVLLPPSLAGGDRLRDGRGVGAVIDPGRGITSHGASCRLGRCFRRPPAFGRG